MTAVMLDAAVGYAQRGWPVLPLWWADSGRCACGVVRCTQTAKHPLGALVPHGLKDATTDAGLVRSWWQRYPHAGIGLRTGVAFDVLDLDADDLDEATAGWGITVDMPGGPVARTGKGWHFYVAPTGRGGATKFLPHADWRGLEGYVVAPPTVHASGRQYSWHASPHLELHPAPAEIVAALGTHEPRRRRSSTPSADEPKEARVTAPSSGILVDSRTRLNLDGLVGRVARAVDGQRNDTLYWAANRVAEHVATGRLDHAGARQVCDDLVKAVIAPDLSETEARRTLRSVSGLRGIA